MNYSAVCEKGPVREKNEDSYGVNILNGCLCMIVADGLGGEVSGEIASKIAVETLMREFELNMDSLNDEEHIRELLFSGFNKANKEIIRYGMAHPESQGMCTTLTAAVQNGTKLYIAHIGDTRAYLCHHREVQKLTNDHNKAAELVRDGMITAEEAKVHPGRNVLVKVLGENVFLKPDFYSYNVCYGDVVMLCSDGLYPYIGKEDFVAALNHRSNLQMFCQNLVDKAIKAGSSDNLTIVAGLASPNWCK